MLDTFHIFVPKNDEVETSHVRERGDKLEGKAGRRVKSRRDPFYFPLGEDPPYLIIVVSLL